MSHEPQTGSWARLVRDHRIPGRPVDAYTAALLSHLTLSEDHGYDVLTVCEAIAHTARDHEGVVDMNQVRARLWDTARGRYTVDVPQLIGATVSKLARDGALVVTGVNLNTDKRGGNAGKPQRLYRWNGDMDPWPDYRRRYVMGMPPPGRPADEQELARAHQVDMGERPSSARELEADEAGTLW